MKVIKNKKVVYFADCMFSGAIDNIEDEWKLEVAKTLEKNGLIFENVKCTEKPPFGESYNILFFDWGGMSLGNDLLGSFCRAITREAVDRPNTYYVMTSSFTERAMEDVLETLHDVDKSFNIFLNIAKFAEFYKTI